MANNFTQAIDQSCDLFDDVVKPALYDHLDGTFYAVENTQNYVLDKLDMNAGIDYLYFDGCGMYGVANRIQVSDVNWGTFTIRKNRKSGKRTEYAKRVEAIDKGYLYPQLTIQSYVDNDNNLLASAIAWTVDILKMIELGLCKTQITGYDQIGRASFYAVSWDDMIAQNMDVKIIDGDNLC